jgi:hypothetical protein
MIIYYLFYFKINFNFKLKMQVEKSLIDEKKTTELKPPVLMTCEKKNDEIIELLPELKEEEYKYIKYILFNKISNHLEMTDIHMTLKNRLEKTEERLDWIFKFPIITMKIDKVYQIANTRYRYNFYVSPYLAYGIMVNPDQLNVHPVKKPLKLLNLVSLHFNINSHCLRNRADDIYFAIIARAQVEGLDGIVGIEKNYPNYVELELFGKFGNLNQYYKMQSNEKEFSLKEQIEYCNKMCGCDITKM